MRSSAGPENDPPSSVSELSQRPMAESIPMKRNIIFRKMKTQPGPNPIWSSIVFSLLRDHTLFCLLLLSFACLTFLQPGIVEAQDSSPAFGKQVSEFGIKHSFLIAGTPTVIVGEDGEVKWEAQGKARDGFVLENGNVLVSIGNVAKEITMEGKEVWSYALAKENKELGTALRLSDGNTLVVERGVKPRLLEITREGDIAVEVPLLPETENAHMQTRMARKLPNGNYLVPHLLAFKVKEYQPDGKVVREIKTDLEELGGREKRNWPFTAIRLENGNTLVNLTNGNKTVDFDSDGKVAWKVTNEDVAGRFADPCGGQRLANGNTVICSYGQKDPKKPKLFEITPDKKVVWEFFHPKARAHEVHVLTTNGKPEGALK